MTEYRSYCRIEGCDAEGVFEDVDEVNDSEWTEFARAGIAQPDGSTLLPAFCPGHSK